MKHLHPDWAVIEMKNEKSRKREHSQIPENLNKKQDFSQQRCADSARTPNRIKIDVTSRNQ